jgi:hypothetical protein
LENEQLEIYYFMFGYMGFKKQVLITIVCFHDSTVDMAFAKHKQFLPMKQANSSMRIFYNPS